MAESEERQVDIKKQYSGTTYQIKVLLLLLCRGKKIENNEHFYLRTEVKDAEKFDDALFYYRKKGEEKYNVRYCQIKNSESENAELKYSDFVSDFEKAVANIKKYFISYRKIKMRTKSENVNVEDFVLCTSYKMPLQLKKDIDGKDDEILEFDEVNTPDELFCTELSQWKRYKIAKISTELENSLMKTTNLDLLTEELVEAIIKSKKQNSSTVILDVGNFWLSIYEFALKLENVFIEKTVTKNKNKMPQNGNNHFVFSKEFLSETSISKECKDFRKMFLNRCGTKFLNLFLREKHFAAEESFINALEKKSKNSTDEMENDTIEKLAEQMSEYIFSNKPLSNEIVCPNNFLNKVFKKVYSNTLKFNGDFVQNKNLPKAITQFKEQFLLSYTIMDLENMQLKFLRNKDITSDKHRFSEPLINNSDHENEIKEFFEKFSIQTLPHHDELMDVIKEEIGEEFNLLKDKWVTYSLLQKVEEWFKKTVEQPLDKTEIDKYYGEIKKDIVIQMTERNIYAEQLKTYNLFFETLPYNWQNFVNPSNKDCSKNQTHLNRILFLTSEEPILTAIKVQDVILSFDFYKKHKSYIMVPASVLLRMEITGNYITNALNLSDSYNLIVIVDDNKAETMTVFNRYLKAQGKKVILISTEKSSFYEMLKNNCVFQEEEDNFYFNQLTSASQQHILRKNVFFQGLSVPLASIVNDAFHSIDSKTIIELFSYKPNIEIGKILEPFKEYDEKFYIERKIGLIKMEDDFFTKTFSNSVFLIEGKSHNKIHEFLTSKKVDKNNIAVSKWDLHSRFIIVDLENAAKVYQIIRDKNANLHIYWFKVHHENLFWFHCSTSAFDKDTKGSPMSCTEIYYEDETMATKFISQSKTVIICDSPGMGKSTILTNLSKKISNDELKWKVRIDLNKYTKYFFELKQNQPKGNDNFRDIGKYVMDKIFCRTPQNIAEKPFELRVFDEMFQKNKVLLIVDGFDEISPNYETIVLDMLEKIKIKTQNHLWITSRLNMKQTLERKLKFISFTIMPFTVKDQNQFLTTLWKSNWKKEWYQNNQNHLEIYAESLITEFNKMTKRNETDIIGIPLQTKMLGDVFQESENEDSYWQSCYAFLKTTSTCHLKKCSCYPTFGNTLQNLYIIYEAFIKKQITRYLNEKKEIDSSKVGWSLTEKMYYTEVQKAHSIMGIFALVSDSTLNKLLTKEEYKIISSCMEQVRNGDACFGLISHITDDKKPLFTHLTFAEYFAANYLIKKLISHPLRVFQLMDTILQSDFPVFLYCMKYMIKEKIGSEELEKSLGNTTVLNFLSKYGLFNCLKYFTMDDNFEADYPQIDKLRKTPLHYAVEFGQIKCVIFILLQKYNRLNKKKDRTVGNEEFDEKVRRLIKVERNSRLFLLQEYIKSPDISGKSAVDLSQNSQIVDILNDFILVGKNSVIPAEEERTALPCIKKMKCIYDFKKAVDGKEPYFMMKDILYLCSIKTILIIFEHCENFLLNHGIFSLSKKETFVDYIICRTDVSEDQKICFLSNLLAKKILSDLRPKVLTSILESAIIHENLKVFKHFYKQEGVCHLYDEFNLCFAAASKMKNSKVIHFLFKTLEKHKISDLSKFLCPVDTNVITMKEIFNQFDGNSDIESKYAEKVFKYLLFSNPVIDKVKFLLSKGAGIHLAAKYGKISWDYAIEKGYNDVVEAMVPYILDSKTKTIMKKYFNDRKQKQIFNCFEAFEQDDEKLCLFLIRKNKNMNIKDKMGKTPIIYACEKGWLEVVILLFEKGACYEDVFDNNGELDSVCLKNAKIATLLREIKLHFETLSFSSSLKNYEIHWKAVDKLNRPLWYIVASSEEKSRIKVGDIFCSTRNAVHCMFVFFFHHSINYQDSEGNTALHLASKGGFKKIVVQLIEYGAYYNIRNNENQTPCDLSENGSILKIFKKMNYIFEVARNGKNVIIDDTIGLRDLVFTMKDDCGRTLLHYAVINRYYFPIKEIPYTKHRVIDEKDIYDKTPLYYAVENNDAEMVKFLLQENATIEKKSYYENIPENQCTYFINIVDQLVYDVQNRNIQELIEKINVLFTEIFIQLEPHHILGITTDRMKNVFDQVSDLCDYDLVLLLLKKGPAIWFLKMYECKSRSVLLLIKLIERIFKFVKSKAYHPSSIIDFIEENNLTEIMVKVRTLCHDTLLHEAVTARDSKMVKWLIKNGSDLSAKNNSNKTALQLAQKNGFKNIIKLLKRRRSKSYQNSNNV